MIRRKVYQAKTARSHPRIRPPGMQKRPTAGKAKAKSITARAKHGKSKRRGDATPLDETTYMRLNAATYGHLPMMPKL